MNNVIKTGALLSLFCTPLSVTLAQTVNEITVQQLETFRPGWASIPTLQQPNFAFGEVNNTQLLAEAGENLNFLSTSNLIVGNTRGFQVIGPDGEVFFVDDIENPKCAVVAQVVESAGNDIAINQTATVVSNVFIERVDFQDCF